MKKILYIDSDDTLYKTMDTFCTQYSALSKDALKLEDLKEWNLKKFLKHPFFADVIFNNPNFFEHLSIKGKDTINIMKELNKYFDLYICTQTNFKSVSGKINAFNRDFPFIKPEQFIFCSNKSLFKGDYIIDDGIHNLSGFKKTNKKGISYCVNMPHNQNINDCIDYRIDTLDDIVMYLLQGV